jgi:hypothetical protein
MQRAVLLLKTKRLPGAKLRRKVILDQNFGTTQKDSPAQNCAGKSFCIKLGSVDRSTRIQRTDDQAFFFSFCSMSTTSLPP